MINRRRLVRAWEKMRDAFIFAGLSEQDAIQAVENACESIEVLPDGEDVTTVGIRRMFDCGQRLLRTNGIACTWACFRWISVFFVIRRAS